MVGGNMAANVINYVYHLVMGRILGPSAYGVLASLYSILYLVSIVPSSASVAIVKFISSSKEEEIYSIYQAIKKFVLNLAVFLSFTFLFLSSPIAKFLNLDNIWLVIVISPTLFFMLITLVNQAASQGLILFWGNVIPTLISSLTKFVVGVALVLLGWSVLGAIYAVLLGSVLAFFYSFWFIKKNLKKAKRTAVSLKPFLSYSLPVLIQALAFTSLFSTDVLLVKHFFEPHEAGIYAALSTLGKIIFFATSPIAATMFPIVSQRLARGENYHKIFLMAFYLTLSVSLAIILFYWLFPEMVIKVLYGSAYLSARAELVWMGLFLLFYSLSSLLVNYSLSLGKSGIVIFPFVGALLQIILIWFWHGTTLQVIQISLLVNIAMFLGISLKLKYNPS